MWIAFLFAPALWGQEEIAHTIRTRNGAVLAVGSVQAVERTRRLASEWGRDLTNGEVEGRLKEAAIPGIREVSSFLLPAPYRYAAWNNRPLEPVTRSLREAQERGDIPFIEGKPLPDARKILELDGFQVILPAREIGATGVYPPVDIAVRSAGFFIGNYAQIRVDGREVSPNKRSVNIAVIHPETGRVVETAAFDTTGTEIESSKFARFVERIPAGYIVAVAGQDDVSRKLTPSAVAAFKSLGSALDLRRHYRLSYALIGVKGARPGQALERVGGEPIQLAVFPKAETDPRRIATLERPKCVLLTGTGPNDPLSLLYCRQTP